MSSSRVDRREQGSARTAHGPLNTVLRGAPALVAVAGLVGAVACGGDDALSTTEQEITGNAGNAAAVQSEQMRPGAGRYRSVMEADGCTGTVIGPHAVLTAYHCARALAADIRYDRDCNISGPGRRRYVRWFADPAVGGDDTRMEVTNSYGNPHAINRKYFLSRGLPVPPHAQGQGCEYRPYRPTWWGNSTTLPHPHDVALFFVPGLTRQFMNQNGITAASIDATALNRAVQNNRAFANGLPWPTPVWFNFELVGRMGAGNKTRRYGPALFSVADVSSPGQLALVTSQAGFVHTNPGDSGGPTWGYINTLWGTSRLVVATTKSGYTLGTQTNAASGNVNTVPVAYQAGMSARQRESVRLNHLWLKARRDDADNDGYPIQCDIDPAAPSHDHRTARCPAPDGRPWRSQTKGYAQGSLMCRDGYVATGYRGKSWIWGVRMMALQCKPLACVQNAASATCGRAYWTDTFGIDNSGAAFTRTCAAGRAMYGFYGRITASNGRIQSIGINCMRPGRAYISHPERGRQSAYGAYRFHHQCSGGRYLQGVVARMMNRTYISGVQGVCTP